MDPCKDCPWRHAQLRAAVTILAAIVKDAELSDGAPGCAVLVASISHDLADELCQWEAHCEDCEHYEDLGDSLELDSQYENQQ